MKTQEELMRQVADLEYQRARWTRISLLLLVVSAASLITSAWRLHQDRLCFSREDLIAVGAGVAVKMSESRALSEPEIDGGTDAH